MARIRSQHPGQWTDEAFVSCSPFARLLAIAIRNEADDQGVFEWKPLQIKMRLFPADNVDVSALLAELSATDQVSRFEVSGKAYGAIRNFRRFQRPEKPKAVHPLPETMRVYVGLSATDCEIEGGDRQPVADESPTNRRPVADESPKVSAEGLGKMEEEGDKMEEGLDDPSLRSGRARASLGTRIPDDWQPTASEIAFAEASGLDAAEAAAEFRDYWRAVPGAKGRKLDWSATFRNSCRMKARSQNGAGSYNRKGDRVSNEERRYRAGVAGLAETLRE
jgi:hypothetical protein